ncbi:MAG: MaoC family dehydratase N-terminal domain-containing protein [Mycobacteriales bacterium]
MPLNRALIGKTYPGSGWYEVGREKIREFALAIGDTNPAYTDPEAAKLAGHPDVVAPPTFLTVLTFRFAGEGPVVDPLLGLNYALVVHGEQRFVHHRPVRPGDRLTADSRIEDIRDAGRNELITVATDVRTVEGEPVATLYSTIVSRGTAAAQGGAQ